MINTVNFQHFSEDHIRLLSGKSLASVKPIMDATGAARAVAQHVED
jgi:ABC-type arginine/histidine transport system permease subunit